MYARTTMEVNSKNVFFLIFIFIWVELISYGDSRISTGIIFLTQNF